MKPLLNAVPATKSEIYILRSTVPTTKSNFGISLNSIFVTESITPGTKNCTRTSPFTMPATQKDSHTLSSLYMKLQAPSSNITKYWACHTKFHSHISWKILANRWNVMYSAGPIGVWSEHETVSPQPASQVKLFFQLIINIFYHTMQQFAPNLTFKPHWNFSKHWTTESDTGTSPSITPATENLTLSLLSTIPATKNNITISP